MCAIIQNMNNHKNTLKNERESLLKDLQAIAVLNEETNLWEARPASVDENEADSNTSADRFEDYEESSALILPLSKKLDEVDHALASIGAGTYGTCEVCGNEIEEARLNANPSSVTCTAHM